MQSASPGDAATLALMLPSDVTSDERLVGSGVENAAMTTNSASTVAATSLSVEYQFIASVCNNSTDIKEPVCVCVRVCVRACVCFM